jgi:hypothetical protein
MMPVEKARKLARNTRVPNDQLEATIAYLETKIRMAVEGGLPPPLIAYESKVIFEMAFEFRKITRGSKTLTTSCDHGR